MSVDKQVFEDLEVELDVDVRWEQNENRWVARCEMFPDLQGLGTTPKGAVFMLRESIYSYWDACKLGGKLPTV